MSAVDELRAEVERLRAESERRRRYLLATLQQENEVRRDLAELRAGIEGLVRDLDAARADGAIYTYGQVQDRLRALLAGSGERPGEGTHTWQGRCCVECEAHVSWCNSPPAPEGGQPGEDHEPDVSDGVPDDEGKALPAGLCYVCQQPEEAHRPAPVEHACDSCEGIDPPSCINYPPTALATNDPAPVVPDGTDVRERARLERAIERLWVAAVEYARVYQPDSEHVLRDDRDLLLAVVGQGVTAEQVEYAIDGAIPDDLPGYRQRYTEHAARRVLALLRHGDADHPSAAVRSDEKEG